MKYNPSPILVFILKFGIFLVLFIVFYVYYFSEVARKYAEKNTYLSTTLDRELIGIQPPLLTICTSPFSNKLVLEKYGISSKALDEPNAKEIKILIALNKTIQDFFHEATHKLNRDFELNMAYEEYGINGDEIYDTTLYVKRSNDDAFQVIYRLQILE